MAAMGGKTDFKKYIRAQIYFHTILKHTRAWICWRWHKNNVKVPHCWSQEQ